MNYPQEIKGKLVTLRLLRPDFFKEYHAMMSATVRQILGLPTNPPFEATRDFLANGLVECEKLDHLFYVIFDAATNKLIGAIKIRAYDSQEALDRGMVGSWLNENYWGGGRYQEALRLILNAFWAINQCSEVTAYINVQNERSLRAHQKAGFKISSRKKSPCDDEKEVYVVTLSKTNIRT